MRMSKSLMHYLSRNHNSYKQLLNLFNVLLE